MLVAEHPGLCGDLRLANLPEKVSRHVDTDLSAEGHVRLGPAHGVDDAAFQRLPEEIPVVHQTRVDRFGVRTEWFGEQPAQELAEWFPVGVLWRNFHVVEPGERCPEG